MSSSSAIRVAARVRFLACAMAIVFLGGWVAWFWPYDDLLDRQGTPLGADFSMFFTAGQMVANGAGYQLYNQADHQHRLHELFPGLSPDFCLPFRYPPAVALVMAAVARLDYPIAWSIFSVASCAAFGAALWLLFKMQNANGPRAAGREDCQEWKMTAIWACLGWPVAWEVLIGGQASMFALLIAVLSILLLTRNHHVLAGAVLALSAYKPNVLALFAIGIAVRYPRVILGAIPVLTAFVGLSSIAGQERLVEYARLALNLASSGWDVETPFWKAHSLAPTVDFFVPGHGRTITILVGLMAAIAIATWWRRADSKLRSAGSISVASLLAVNALFNPYTPIYDLILLAPAAWLIAGTLLTDDGSSRVSASAMQWWLAGLFFGPHLSQAVARALGVQLFPFMLAGIGAWVLLALAARINSFRTSEVPESGIIVVRMPT